MMVGNYLVFCAPQESGSCRGVGWWCGGGGTVTRLAVFLTLHPPPHTLVFWKRKKMHSSFLPAAPPSFYLHLPAHFYRRTHHVEPVRTGINFLCLSTCD